jgi:hypothetical protein
MGPHSNLPHDLGAFSVQTRPGPLPFDAKRDQIYFSESELVIQGASFRPRGLFKTWQLPDLIPHVHPRWRRYAWGPLCLHAPLIKST